jgi:hypothetical protein
MTRPSWGILSVVALLLLAGMLAFLLGQPRSLVDWSDLRAVALESDDWGLAGFSPSLEAWTGVDREELAPGRFPPVYWHTTLEDSNMVGRLCRLLAGVKGRDGLPAVFQPNYVMGSLDLEVTPDGQLWHEYAFPEFPAAYRRPGLIESVNRGIAAGVWYPELHARFHYDPQLRRERTVAHPVGLRAALNGITLFPGSEDARELGAWRPAEDLSRELQESRAIFRRVFGREPGSIIAPDYTWNSGMERIWQEQGISIIQGKREQRNPAWGRGLRYRLAKILDRRWMQIRRPDRQYLERTVRLEPVQSPDPDAVVQEALEATRLSWRRNLPAVVETHRVNFAHLEETVVAQGLSSMRAYLGGLVADTSHLPLFLVDSELAQLQKHGVSAARRGESLVLRNGTHGRRLVGLQGGKGVNRRVFFVPAMTTMVVKRSGQTLVLPLESP